MREHLWIASISVLIFILVIFAWRYNLLEFVELKTLDKRHSYASSRVLPSDQIVLVTIDSKSQSVLGSLPWSHDVYLALYNVLKEARPKAVGMMIWFNREWEEGEVELEPGNNLFIIKPYSLPPVMERDKIPTVTSWYPIPLRFRNARGKSYSHMTLSPEDGIYRSAQMVVRDKTSGRLRFPIELLMTAELLGVNEDQIVFRSDLWRGRYVQLGDLLKVPVDLGGRFYITYLQPDNSFRSISFVDVLEIYQEGNPRQLRRLFAGKVVLVGETEGAYKVPTPSGKMTALEIRANLVNDLITRTFILRLNPRINFAYTLLFLLTSISITLLVHRYEGRVSLLAVAYTVFLLFHLALCFSLFQNWGIWLDMVTPGLFISLNGISCTLLLNYINLRRTQTQLVQSEKEAAFGVMSAQVRHEIRNILNSIRAPAEMVRNNFQKGDPLGLKDKPDEIISEMNSIIERVMKLNDMIENELSFFQEASLRMQPVQISELIRSAVEICDEEIRENNVDLFIEVDPNLPLISADRDKLRIAFINLIRNACQAMPNGGSLLISAGYHAEKRGSFVKISFKDTGCGMSRETMKRIFEPFFTTKPRGLGLGLANVQNIVKLHHGKIEVESKEDVGTTFSLLLPLMAVEEEEG
jgi:signal transduction histidine kinase